MTTTEKDIYAAIRDVAGEVRAEMAKDAEKLIKSLEEKYGSAAAAKAQGVETNFFAREGIDQPARKPETFKAGRFVRALAAARGDIDRALSTAKARGDKETIDLLDRAAATRAKAMTLSSFSDGGALVPEEFSAEVIGLLYPMLTISALGAQMVPMPNGNLTLPFLSSGVSAAYIGETQNITPSQQVVGHIQLQAKKLAALVPLSNDLLRSPSARADAFVQADLVRALAVATDVSFLRGSGSAASPKGVRNWADSANVFNQTGTTLQAKVDDLGKCQRVIQEQNVPLDKAGFILSPRTGWGLRNTLDSLGNFVFIRMMEAGMIMGFPFKESTSVPNTLGSGNKSEVIFGAFGHVLIGDTETIEISAHPDGAFHDGSAIVSGISADMTPIRAIARHDLACRYRGKEIARIDEVTWA